MTIFQIALLTVVIFLCIFTIIDRICKCCEQCALSKAYGKYMSSVSNKTFKQFTEGVKDEQTSKLS